MTKEGGINITYQTLKRNPNNIYCVRVISNIAFTHSKRPIKNLLRNQFISTFKYSSSIPWDMRILICGIQGRLRRISRTVYNVKPYEISRNGTLKTNTNINTNGLDSTSIQNQFCNNLL